MNWYLSPILYVHCSQRRGMVTLDMSKRCVCAYNYYIINECLHRSSGRWFNFASNIQWFNYGVEVKLWLSDVTSPKLSFDLCKLGMRFHITFFRCIISRGFMNATCRQMTPLLHNSSWSHTRAATQKSLKCETAYWNKFKESELSGQWELRRHQKMNFAITALRWHVHVHIWFWCDWCLLSSLKHFDYSNVMIKRYASE